MWCHGCGVGGTGWAIWSRYVLGVMGLCMGNGRQLQNFRDPADKWRVWHDDLDEEAAMALKGVPRREYHIYVIELDKSVLGDRRFIAKNPGYVEGKPCVYVGMTGRTPEIRFEQHKRGYKASHFAKKYGIRLKPRQYRCHNPMTREDAEIMEVEKARRLRNRGYGVWQN